jgi:hypothetical protein
MIVDLLLNVLLLVIGAIFSILPIVYTLPTIAGYDIDAALVSGIGQFNVFTTAFWPLSVMFQGFLVIMLYYALKMGLRFFLGHRAPGQH